MATSIEVTGLAKATTEDKLTEYFSYYGEVVSVAVKMSFEKVNTGGGKTVRCGVVTFSNAKACKKALAEAELHILDGKPIDTKAAAVQEDEQWPDDEEWPEAEAATTKKGRAVGKKAKAAEEEDWEEPAPKKKKKGKRTDGEPKTLWVSSLSKKTTKESLQEYFSYYGKVKVVMVEGQKRVAEITFANSEHADAVMAEKDGHLVDNRSVEVRTTEKRMGDTKMFIGGLSPESTTESLIEYFEYYGEVLKAQAKIGFGFVEFVDGASAELVFADALNEKHVIDGKEVEVRAFYKTAPTDKLFVGGLSKDTSEDSCREYFSYYGEVALVRVKIDGASGKCRGFGFVKFQDPVSAELVLTESEKHEIDGRKVTVRICEKNPAPKLFIGGMDKATTSKGLNEYLSYYGDLREADVKVDRETGASKGFGFAKFVDPVSVELVLSEADGHMIDGKLVTIRIAQRGAATAARVFVGGLHPETTSENLYEYLACYGELSEVDVKADPVTGKSKGFGFAQFVELSSAELAVSELDHMIDGKSVVIRKADSSRQQNVKLFVGGLHPETTSDSLNEYMAYFGDLTEVEVKADPSTGRSRCFGFVTFASPEGARAALAEEQHEIDGKVVAVQASDRGKGKKGKGKGNRSDPGTSVASQVVIEGLDESTTAEALYEYLVYYGELTEVDVKVDNEGNSRGFAYATFADVNSVPLILAESNHVVEEKAVTIQSIGAGDGEAAIAAINQQEENAEEW
eukprot:TRINITY_DN11609_c0_g2_i1.p1 TRINITY_DN11609_c0_g2~~TRINITY_DN11609_c0_g2_i1.p1  ORF type:complete len:741 (-),score=183.49 TRINITY_DN11609_c0_g2_i1:88-2310(-)